ncbi:MAG TPA: UDP-N-acetylmuramoyl-L-alanyl-D-glutamate--2,6-diaminopimelate ligase [Microthrixaceae bacterium]|nr:UDP-N-acetylmuramoyl-L-alanyl-D-glutamate--2,6-diaminopimelate ligase [Microthrixaceae bacterium]
MVTPTDTSSPPNAVPHVYVTDVVHSSAEVPVGALFVAVRGARTDGHEHAADAVDAGAAALLVDHELPIPVPQIVVADTRAAMALAAAACWGSPSLELAVVGVTGTNGKTTVVSLVDGILRGVGSPAEVIGTLTGVRTTPEATDLQPLLRDAVDRGVEVVAMEVSSHALELHRVDGIRFAVTAFTNLGVDHLDFHGTQERYFEAKARLFDTARSDVAVVNVDDVRGRLLRDAAPADRPVVGCSIEDLDDVVIGPTGSGFTWRSQRVSLPLVGRFNVSNALIAAEICVALGHDPEAVAPALSATAAPPGRLEPVVAGQPYEIFVDYAHTPDGLAEVLATARDLTSGRLIVVFGAGGDRDTSKRPRMGEVACRLADVVVITSDNPRSEDPSAIIAAVRAGCVEGEPVTEIDRRTAIGVALDAAGPGDVVVIAGKGHEVTQTIGERILDFDDRVVARALLADRGWVGPGGADSPAAGGAGGPLS